MSTESLEAINELKACACLECGAVGQFSLCDQLNVDWELTAM